MPPKKKGSKKKKGASKKAAALKKQQLMNPFLPGEVLIKEIPKVLITISLATQNQDDGIFTSSGSFPITSRLSTIAEKVFELHQGAVKEIKLFKDKYNLDEPLDQEKRLIDFGLFGNSEIKLYYDFTPVIHPLLK